jgi:exopolysaccharide biosynthesis polyprenyl glycosylphosphotransferase
MIKVWGSPVSKWPFLLLAGDAVMYCLSVPLGFCLSRSKIEMPWLFVEIFPFPLMLLGIAYLLVLYVANLYDPYADFRRRENISQVILSCLIGTLVVLLISSLPRGHVIGYGFIEWQGVAFVWLMAFWRYTFSAVSLQARLKRKVLIVGAGRAGQEILKIITQLKNSGFVVTGFLDDDPKKKDASLDGVPVLGNSSQLDELIAQHHIGMVVVAITHDKSFALINSLVRLSLIGVELVDMPSLYELLASKIPTDHIADAWLLIHSLNSTKVYYRHFKRITDLALAAVGLALTWPLWILIAVAIKLDTPGPVFFHQKRLGQDGKPFQILKFRTMVQNAESAGPQFAKRRDPRVNRVGGVLRKARLDELPQLINILKGEMSFIGPRPERPVFIQEFSQLVPVLQPARRAGDTRGEQVVTAYRERLPYYSYRLLIKPGITGWAQVRHSYSATLEETKEKLQYDLYYIKNMSLLLDLAILLKTIRIVLFGWGR